MVLKTLGLVALMTRAGIPIPAEPGARVDLFDPVLADIGDLQSVTGDLSTFSGHLVVSSGLCVFCVGVTGCEQVALRGVGNGLVRFRMSRRGWIRRVPWRGYCVAGEAWPGFFVLFASPPWHVVVSNVPAHKPRGADVVQVAKAVLSGAKAGSLVLMDEMGSGTDPMQGAALAQSLLEVGSGLCRCCRHP